MNKIRIKITALSLCIITVFFAFTVEAQKEILFDGRGMPGWAHVGEGSFEIEDGLLRTIGGMGLLWYSKRMIENVKITVVYKGASNNNSGIFIRIPEKPEDPWMAVNLGYEVQIDDREDIYHKTGVLYSFTGAQSSPGIPREWNKMEIILDGYRTIVKVNGVLVTDFKEGDPVPEKKMTYEPDRGPRPRKGYFGLQNHSDDDVIYFKEISLEPLQN